MTRFTFSTFLIFITLCVLFSPFVVASDKQKNDKNLRKCDSFWWKNKSEYLKWTKSYCKKYKRSARVCERKIKNMYLSDWKNLEEREKSYKNKSKNKDITIDILHDIWSKWSSFAKCRCESVNWKIKNPAGISLCYQISWLDKTRGDFVGQFVVFRDKKSNTLKNATFNKLMYKMPSLVKTVETSQWKNQEKLDNSSSIENIYIYSKIKNYKSMGEIDMTNMTSPSQYMVDVGKNLYSLVKDNDAKILSIPDFLMSELEPNNSVSEMPSVPTTRTTSTRSASTSKSSTPPTPPPTPITTPTTSSPDVPTTIPISTNATTSSSPSPSPDVPTAIPISTNATTSSSPSPSSDSQPQSQESGDDGEDDLPGMSFGVLPIGLIIFASIIFVGLAIYFHSIFDKRRWRKIFRSRQENQLINRNRQKL